MTDREIGVLPVEAMASLSGLELLSEMAAGRLPAPPMGGLMGFRLVEVSPGAAVFEGVPGPHLLNPLGGVHGGFALTLIDSAAGCALHSELPAGTGYTTIETKVNMTRPIRPDGRTIRCEGRVVTRGRQIGTAEAKLLDADGKVLAHGTSTLIILAPR